MFLDNRIFLCYTSYNILDVLCTTVTSGYITILISFWSINCCLQCNISTHLTLNINTPDNVVYDKFFFNYGYVYNTHSGFFTAPSARLYIFTWTSIFAPWKIIDAEILVNGKQKGLANCNNDNNPRYENWTNKRPLVLNAGNKVNIRTLLQIFCIELDIVLKDIKFS